MQKVEEEGKHLKYDFELEQIRLRPQKIPHCLNGKEERFKKTWSVRQLRGGNFIHNPHSNFYQQIRDKVRERSIKRKSHFKEETEIESVTLKEDNESTLKKFQVNQDQSTIEDKDTNEKES